MDNKDVECPMCFKEFPLSTIETHVSKCLFLNESSQRESQNFLKRPATLISKSTPGTGKAKQPSPLQKKSKMRFLKTETVKKSGISSSASLEDYKKTDDISPENSVKPEIKKTAQKDHVPLAERMRPTSLEGYIGQKHILGPQTVLSQLFEKGEIPSIILWGPPGCGKTSLANVVAHMCKQFPDGKMRYVKLSAAMSGVNDVKEAVSIAANDLKFGRRTVMFMDEIHRFNKLQQDIFLPHLEAGTVTLIGATTENPSFSLNSALLSRCRVVVLEKLTTLNLISILKKAVASLEGQIHTPRKIEGEKNLSADMSDVIRSGTSDRPEPAGVPKFLIDGDTVQWLAETCDGDARIALGGLELAVQSKVPIDGEFSQEGPGSITLEDVKESLKKTHMLYDRKGEQHYDIISALHKSVRASDENASLYWLTRMMSGGEDPVYIARRLVRMATEDIGLEDPKALGIAVHTMHACKMMGMPECDVILAQCVTYLARAPKSRLMEDALRAAQRLVTDHKGPQPGVPLPLRNAPTKLMKQLGYGSGYNMLHKDESGLNYMPEGLEDVDFFKEEDDTMD